MGESSATEAPAAESTEAAVAAEAVVGPAALLTAVPADVRGVGGRKLAQAAIAA